MRRAELSRRKTLLESELRAAGDSLGDIGGGLRFITNSNPQQLSNLTERIQKAPDICELGRIKAMVSELADTLRELIELRQTAIRLNLGDY